jgi:hypothetical protein
MFKTVFACSARCIAGAALALCSLLAAAQGMDPESGKDRPRVHEEPKGEKPELEVEPPAFPKPDALVRYPSDASASQVFVDPASLSLGTDEVLHYTLVVRGPGGAQNVTFEGMRCATAERRVYAYGRRDGTWSPAHAPNWTQITYTSNNHYYFDLNREVFCDGAAPESIPVIIRNLKAGGRGREFSVPTG